MLSQTAWCSLFLPNMNAYISVFFSFPLLCESEFGFIQQHYPEKLEGFSDSARVWGGRGAGAIDKNLLVQREEAWGSRVCCLSPTVPKQPGQALTLLRLKLQHEGCTQASYQDLFCSLRRLGCLHQAISV